MEDNLKIPKLNNLGHLLATPPRGYSQNNLECRKVCRTNDPFSFVNDWQENIKGKKRKIKFKKFRKNISQIQLQHVDFNLIQIQTKCRNTPTYHTHTHTHTPHNEKLKGGKLELFVYLMVLRKNILDVLLVYNLCMKLFKNEMIYIKDKRIIFNLT